MSSRAVGFSDEMARLAPDTALRLERAAIELFTKRGTLRSIDND
jgi:hypothetical protein